MKRLIRWALNHLPRTFLQRIAGISVPVLGWFYIGRGVECPVCGTRAAQVPALRLRPLPSERPLPPLPLARTAPPAMALPATRNRPADRVPPHPAHRSRSVPDAQTAQTLRRSPGPVPHRRPRKSAGRYAFRRAAHSPRGRFYGRGDLQSHPGTCRRRPAGRCANSTVS